MHKDTKLIMCTSVKAVIIKLVHSLDVVNGINLCFKLIGISALCWFGLSVSLLSLDPLGLLGIRDPLYLLLGWYVFYAEYSGTPLNGYPSTVDTCNLTDNSEYPNCISIDFSIFKSPQQRTPGYSV